MSRARYAQEILLALAFTSASMNLLNSRRESEAQKRRYTTQIQALEELVTRQRAGEIITDHEFLKVRKRIGLLGDNSSMASASTLPEGSFTKPDSTDASNPVKQTSHDDEILSEWNKALEDSNAQEEQPSLLRLLLPGMSFDKAPTSQTTTFVTKPEPTKDETDPSSPKKPIFY
ncbi:hypothetical protein FRC19_002099 [Serendipita sp. 401]|nr:hypothetical protein FRC15_001233 [Serendipita sp. 397]KAG8813911.1 hypothetical protein FRC19_002099 [Serendipita sp. 401]KAG8832904.1 hypothetical protein FRC20_007783 [Serendipita sp. 405]